MKFWAEKETRNWNTIINVTGMYDWLDIIIVCNMDVCVHVRLHARVRVSWDGRVNQDCSH